MEGQTLTEERLRLAQAIHAGFEKPSRGPRAISADRFDLAPRAPNRVQKQYLSRFGAIEKAR